MTQYLTEIIEKSARNNKYCYSTENFAEVQKNNLMGRLYDRIDKFYQDRIDKGEIYISYFYMDGEDIERTPGVEYICVGLYDSETGEQVL